MHCIRRRLVLAALLTALAASAGDPVRIIAFLREQNPKVVILVGHLNFNGGAALKIRPLVEAMAKEENQEASPVIAVHFDKGWRENPQLSDTDTFDWAHPNPKGQQKMAEAWFAAMKPYLKLPNK